MSAPDTLYLHVVSRQTYLELLALELYGSLDSELAKDFLYYNQLAAGEFNEVLEGQLLYLPQPTFCYAPSIEDAIVKLIGRLNVQIRHGMDAEQRRVIAKNPQLVNNASEDPNIFIEGASWANTAATSLISFSSEANKMVGESLKELERAYVDTFKRNGKFTPHFFEQRQRIYSRLDTAIGRYGRTLAFGSQLDEKAKEVLRISSKSQIVQWKNSGSATNVDAFEPHFDRFNKTARYLKAGGFLTAAVGVSINEVNIREACKADRKSCDFTKYSLRGETVGGLAVGTGGGALAAWGVCTLALGIPTGGTSALWCGVLAGGAGSAVGGYAGSKAGKASGELIYEYYVR